MHLTHIVLAGLVVGTALAQSTIVSPAGSDTTEGNGSNTIPFGSSIARRYMQIHDDIGGSPKLITRLSFRPTTHANAGLVGTRIYDIELYMGEGVPGATPNFQFDANYNGWPPTVVGSVSPQAIAMCRVWVAPRGTRSTRQRTPAHGKARSGRIGLQKQVLQGVPGHIGDPHAKDRHRHRCAEEEADAVRGRRRLRRQRHLDLGYQRRTAASVNPNSTMSGLGTNTPPRRDM